MIFRTDGASTAKMDWQTALAITWQDATIWTGNAYFDIGVHLASWLVSIASAIIVGMAFTKAIKDYRRNNPHAKLPRTFWFFLALALVATLITNGLRFEHKRLKWRVQTEQFKIEWARADMAKPSGEFNEVDGLYRSWIESRAQEKADFMQRGIDVRWPVPFKIVKNEEHEIQPRRRLDEKLLRKARDEIRAENGRLPFLQPWNWPKAKFTSWDYLDMLVDTPARFFWAAQWFSGSVAWMLFVAIECQRRQLSGHLARAFICLGSLSTLAGAQCLFFALAVLVPRKRSGRVSIPRTWVAMCIVTMQSVGLILFAWLVQDKLFRKAIKDYSEKAWTISLHGTKALAISAPLMMHCTTFSMPELSCRQAAARPFKRPFVLSWHAIALVGCALHFHIILFALSKIDPEERRSFFPGLSMHPWLHKRNPMDHHRMPIMQTFGVLGDHAWINALAFDVLLSALAIASWSVVARLDARSMARCSLFPWMDWMTEEMKIIKYHTLPDIRTSGGLRGGATRSGAEYLLQDGPPEVSSEEDEEPPWIKRRSHRGAQRKTKRAQSRDPALSAPRTRGRVLRSTSSRAASQQLEVPQRRRSRSASLGISMPVGALRGVSPSAHSRGRAASTVRRSSRIREKVLSNDPEGDERTLMPAGPAFHDLAGQAEQAGLSLTLFAFGGLGMASAAVFGAEELAD